MKKINKKLISLMQYVHKKIALFLHKNEDPILRYKWETHFCWYPVFIKEIKKRKWLSYVLRRGPFSSNDGDLYEYKPIYKKLELLKHTSFDNLFSEKPKEHSFFADIQGSRDGYRRFEKKAILINRGHQASKIFDSLVLTPEEMKIREKEVKEIYDSKRQKMLSAIRFFDGVDKVEDFKRKNRHTPPEPFEESSGRALTIEEKVDKQEKNK